MKLGHCTKRQVPSKTFSAKPGTTLLTDTGDDS
jgi:hypothetical protein